MLNAAQLFALLPVLWIPNKVVGRRRPLVVAGVLGLVAILGIVVSPATFVFPAVAVIGVTSAFVLTLSLALPPLLVEPEDVPRLSAGIFTIAYLGAVAIPIMGGALWDLTGLRETAFAPCAVGSLLVAVLGSRAELHCDPGPGG